MILPKSSGMRAECQHNVLAMKSFRNNQRRDQQGTGDDYQNADDVTDMAQDHVYSRNPVLGSSSTLSSQSSTSTFDSGIDGDQQVNLNIIFISIFQLVGKSLEFLFYITGQG